MIRPSVPFLSGISIEGLFGLYDHQIELRPSAVTLVAGPNGVGKTTLLGLTHALLSGNYTVLSRAHFARLSVTSQTGECLMVEPELPSVVADATHRDLVLTLSSPRPQSVPLSTTIRIPFPDASLPSWLRPVGDGWWEDIRDGEMIHDHEMVARFGTRVGVQTIEPTEPPEWFLPSDWATDFIETKRLDSLLMRRPSAPARIRQQQGARAPIHVYLDAVRDAMRTARAASSRIAQQRDRTFAGRLIDKASRLTVKEPALRERYELVEDRARELADNGLLADSLDVLPEGTLNPTEKRILNFFLDDFDAKMIPLQPVSDRLNQLREIVGSKFLNKHIDIDAEAGPVFVAEPGNLRLDADALSSGEQHELALMSRLLFSVSPGTTVLIDEPELSLHVSWQHRMLNDLIAIAEIVGLSFVLATHSTAIINGRWELVEELGPIDDSIDQRDTSEEHAVDVVGS